MPWLSPGTPPQDRSLGAAASDGWGRGDTDTPWPWARAHQGSPSIPLLLQRRDVLRHCWSHCWSHSMCCHVVFSPPCLIPSLTHQSFTLSHVPVGIPECCPAVGTGGQGDPELGLLPTEISAMGRAMVPSAHPSHCCAQGTAQGLCSAPP